MGFARQKIALALLFAGFMLGAKAFAGDFDDYVQKKKIEYFAKYKEDYGGFALPAEEAARAQAELESIFEKFAGPEAKEFEFVFINHPSPKAIATRIDGKKKFIVTRGLLDRAQNLDQLAAAVAHELGAFAKTDGTSRPADFYSNPRPTMIAVDEGAMEAMEKAGYDSRQYREFLLLHAQKKQYTPDPLLSMVFSVPPDAIRITNVDRWLTQNAARLPRRRDPLPWPSSLKAVLATKPTVPKPAAPPEEAPKPMNFRPTKTPEKLEPLRSILLPDAVAAYQKNPAFRALSAGERFKILQEPMDPENIFRFLFPNATAPLDAKGRPDYRLYFAENRVYLGPSHNSETKRAALPAIAAIGRETDDKKLQKKVLEHIAEEFQDHARLENAIELFLPFEEQIRPRPPEATGAKGFRAFAAWYESPAKGDLENVPRLGKAQKMQIVERLLQETTDPEELFALVRFLRKHALEFQFNLLPISTLRLLPVRLKEIHRLAVERNAWDIILGRQWPVRQASRTGGVSIFGDDERLLAQLVQDAMHAPGLSMARRIALRKGHDQMRMGQGQRPIGFEEKFLRFGFQSYADLQAAQAELAALEAQGACAPCRFSKGEFAHILHGNLQWKVPFAEVERIAADNFFWDRVPERKNYSGSFREDVDKEIKYGGTTDSVAIARTELERRGQGPLGEQLVERVGGISGPAAEYELSHSERMQRALLSTLKNSGEFPTDPKVEHALFLRFARRGPTQVTDAWAKTLYLNPAFTCAECLDTLLSEKLVFDFDYRKQIYDKYRALLGLGAPSGWATTKNRIPRLVHEIHRIHEVFPEESLPRAAALEELANVSHANQIETEIIEAAKAGNSGKTESTLLRMFSGVYAAVMESEHQAESVETKEKRIYDFLRFLQGKEDLSYRLKDKLSADGKITDIDDKLRRTFAALTPEMKGLALAPFLVPPHGLCANPESCKRVVAFALEGVDEKYRAQAQLLLEARLYALDKVAPERKNLELAFLLGQAGREGRHPGEALRHILGAQGNSGASIAQKLRQRRLVPDDFLPYLEDMQDSARKPSRHRIFQAIQQAMKIPNVDEVLSIEEKLGDASSKIVVRVRYKDGRIGPLEDRALKVLWENFERVNEIEAEQLGHMVDYLEKEGGPGYRKLRSALKSVQRGLALQADARNEAKNFAEMRQIYRSGEVDAKSGFAFHVTPADPRAGAGVNYVNDMVAEGVGIRQLKEIDPAAHARVMQAIYDKEESILFDGNHVRVRFDSDRHAGNYRVDLSKNPPVIHVIDYPLFSQVTKEEQRGLLRALGLVEYASAHPEVRTALVRDIADLLRGDLGPGAGIPKKALAELEAGILEAITRAGSGPADENRAVYVLYELFSLADSLDIPIRNSVYDYLTAIGNIYDYSKYKAPVNGRNPYVARIEGEVRRSLESYAPNLKLGEKCVYGWAKLKQALGSRRR